jgi:anti-sigma factor RsiW
MTHLGDRISAFVDGELDHDARDRVLAHLAQCTDCRLAADQHRRLKSALAGAGVPGPSEPLVRSLISMSEPGEPTPRERRPLPSGARQGRLAAGARPSSAPAGRTRDSRGPGDKGSAGRFPGTRARVGSRRRVVYVAAASALSISAVAFAAAFSIGEPSQQGPGLTPPLDSYTYQHAQTSSRIAGEPAFTAVFGTTSFPASTAGFGVPAR